MTMISPSCACLVVLVAEQHVGHVREAHARLKGWTDEGAQHADGRSATESA